MINRQRGSALDPDGISIVRARYKQLGLNQLGWSLKANVSISTVKRLLRGNRVDLNLLTASLRALGLEAENFTLRKAYVSIPVGPSIQPTSSQPRQPDFYMRATFTDTNRRQIEYALDDLQALLDGQSLEITNSDNCVTISSDFPESLRDEVETILNHIQSLSEKCVVRGDVVLART
ncbi:MAG: hypothetical protein AAFZ17_01500 [Cyanobacteria bacterium J06650_10]